MRGLRNSIAALLLLTTVASAQFTTNFYPVTNAPIRTYDAATTNWTFAKDVWREEIGEAILERMVVVGEYDSYLEHPPVRYPWENQFVSAAKSNLYTILDEYLDLRYTNSVGVFTNFYMTNLTCYTERFWTKSNILEFCDLPTNFFEWTPVRYLGPNGLTTNQANNSNLLAGFTTADYGWHGLYELVNALDYYHPAAAWVEYGLYDGVFTGAWDATAAATNVCFHERYDVPSPWTTWTPTNYTTNIVIGSYQDAQTNSLGTVALEQFANGKAQDVDGIEASVQFWAVDYYYSVPHEFYEGAYLQHYTNAFHPTNVLDAQAFTVALNAWQDDQTNYWAGLHAKRTTDVYYISVPPPSNVFQLASREAWGVTVYSNKYIAASSTATVEDITTDINVSDVTLNGDMLTNSCSGDFAFYPWGSYEPPDNCFSPVAYGPNDFEDLLPFTIDTDACSNDDPVTWDIWNSSYKQYSIKNNVALKPAWKYRKE